MTGTAAFVNAFRELPVGERQPRTIVKITLELTAERLRAE